MDFDAQLGPRKEIMLGPGVVRYRDIGEGRPIVFVHGLMTNSVLWHKVIPLLANGARCVAPDLPLGSHALPMNSDADLSLPALADLVNEFIAALDLTDVTLVGVTIGGVIATMAAQAEQSERIGRLVLLPTDAYENVPPKILRHLKVAARIPGSIWAMAQSLRMKANRAMPFSYGWVAKKPFEDEMYAEFLTALQTQRGTRRDTAKAIRGISPRHSLAAAAKYGQFRKPVLLVWSKEDRLFPYEHAERMAASFPDARLETVPDSYTYVVQDQPHHVATVLRQFHEAALGAQL
jgi:pimeloyl-ACP methyl ester carboxylesterase